MNLFTTYLRFANRSLQYWSGLRLPFRMSWFVNSECQIRCGGCFFFSRSFPRGEPLSTSQRFELVDQLIELKQPYLTLLGGEPFRCKDLFPIAQRSMAGGIAVEVTTNGLDISEQDLERVDGSFFKIWISVDGPKEAHEANRGPGTYDRAMYSLKQLISRRKYTRVGVSTVLNRHNASQMPDFLRMLHDIGVEQICFKDNLIPSLRVDDETLMITLDKIKQIKKEFPGFIRQEMEFLEELPGLRQDGHARCFLDKHLHIALLPEGTVSACVSFPVPIGNVKEKPLVEILKPGPKERYAEAAQCPGCTRSDSMFFLRFLERPWKAFLPSQVAKLIYTL
ncbi:MAG: 4Fe-4S cluster-binding domain-containing protein [Deltaproteobacteria bacterium]|nr:4Fe-4S cluster-binding domain-containing protein [Deltaproteobacteria bacterium]